MKRIVFLNGVMISGRVTKMLFQKVFTLPQDFTIIALTATATVEVQQDIREKLNIAQTDQIKTSTKRRNLIFKVNPDLSTSKIYIGLY